MRLAGRLIVAASLLLSLAAHAQPYTHAGVFPGRLPGDFVSPPPPTLQSPWTQAVIGTGTGGSATSSSGILTDSCKGSMGFTADAGNLVYQSLSGDQEMIGRLDAISSDQVWSRYVPIVRQSTAAGSKYAALFFDHRGYFSFNWRLTLDAHNDWVGADTAYTAPQWWRITRIGSSFAGYVGPTSAGPWTLNGSQSVTMSDPVLWGVVCENGLDSNPAVQTSLLPTIASTSAGAGTLQLATASFSVNEDVGTYVFHVSRVGGTTGAVGATLSRDGTSTATNTTDYTASPTLPATLSWSNADGADKTVTVTVVNRSGSQVSRHLDVSLGSATGGATIGSPSAEVLTINDVSAGSQTRVRAGYYEDCYSWMPHGGDFNIFIGSDGYIAVKNCIDFAAANSPEKGVSIPILWASLEGDTPGCFDSSCSNGLASAGKIGFPLIDDLLNYAASKHIAVFFEWDWFNYYSDADCTLTQQDNSPNGAYYVRGGVPKYLLPTSCGGTDSTSVYGGGIQRPGFDGTNSTYFLKVWDADVADRMIAVLNAYAVRYDNNTALEGWMLFGEEGDAAGHGIPTDGSVPGYSYANIDAQFLRVALTTKPNWPHTNIVFAGAWMRGADEILAQSVMSSTTAVGIQTNNAGQELSFAECAYVGATSSDGRWCDPGASTNTHNYQTELPFMLWTATPYESCMAQQWTQPGLTMAQWHTLFMTTGKFSTGKPLKPVWWITAVYKNGLTYCPSDTIGTWGTIGGTGWYNAIQTRPTNTTCPTMYTGGCNTAQP